MPTLADARRLVSQEPRIGLDPAVIEGAHAHFRVAFSEEEGTEPHHCDAKLRLGPRSTEALSILAQYYGPPTPVSEALA